MINNIIKLFKRNSPCFLKIGEYVIFPYSVSHSLSYNDTLKREYCSGRVIGKPELRNGRWMQLITFDELLVPDYNTFINNTYPKWVANPPVMYYSTAKGINALVRVTKKGAELASPSQDNADKNGAPVFIRGEFDFAQTRTIIGDIHPKRLAIMKDCWSKWVIKHMSTIDE